MSTQKFLYFNFKKKCIFASYHGALAQLARVLDWQSKGHGFDSHTLHKMRQL